MVWEPQKDIGPIHVDMTEIGAQQKKFDVERH